MKPQGMRNWKSCHRRLRTATLGATVDWGPIYRTIYLIFTLFFRYIVMFLLLYFNVLSLISVYTHFYHIISEIFNISSRNSNVDSTVTTMYLRFQCTVTSFNVPSIPMYRHVSMYRRRRYIEICVVTVHWNSLGDGTSKSVWRQYIELCLRWYIEIRLATVHLTCCDDTMSLKFAFGDGTLKYVCDGTLKSAWQRYMYIEIY